jgi:hypothetical protein
MTTPSESRKEVAAQKAVLKASLPDLLRRASSDPKAAEEALRACAMLRKKPPISLVTEPNVSRSFSAIEISKSLSLFSNPTESVSLSVPLTALRTKHLTDRKTATQVAKALNRNITKLLPRNTKTTRSSKGIKDKPTVLFTQSTVADSASVVLWILIRLFELSEQNKAPALALARALINSLREIWRHSDRAETAELVVNFFHLLRKNLKRSVYVDLEDDEEISGLAREANAELAGWANFALLDGRLKHLKAAIRTAEGDERAKILSQLQETCRTHPSQVLPELVEWVAQEIDRVKQVRKPLVAADASQSSDLNYVAVSLLDAWNAATEGDRAARSLMSIERLARDLFSVEFADSVGEVVGFDERTHEITPPGKPATTSVRVVRPGIRWSDGTRVRSLVRTLVTPID